MAYKLVLIHLGDEIIERGEMNSWIWLGGCVLGLFGVERAQRIFFPGDPPLWGWRWGRTRRQEETTGGGPGDRTTPLSLKLTPDQVLPGYSNWLKRLELQPSMQVEEELRKQLPSIGDREGRALLCGLLAQASLLLDNRFEAHCLIEEAEESLLSGGATTSQRGRAAAEALTRMKGLLLFQEGDVPAVSSVLDESEARFGRDSWSSLLRAENVLLAGETAACQSILFAHLRDPKSRHPEKPTIELPAGAWAVLGESYLRERDWEKLDRVLAVCLGLRKLPVEDRIAVIRLRVELLLHDGEIEEAWRQVGGIHQEWKGQKTHRGLARAFHLSCARVHLYEADTKEGLRRLQLAENESRYPIAIWEVEFLRAIFLETDNRMDEANAVWRSLASDAPFTYFGRVAERRTAVSPASQGAARVTEPSTLTPVH